MKSENRFQRRQCGLNPWPSRCRCNALTTELWSLAGSKMWGNRPFPSSLVPPFHNESKCETFHMKMSSACSFIFKQIKVIFIRMVSHLDSLWNRGTRDSEMAYLNKEGVFQRWNVPFVRYDLQSNVTVFFDFVCTENTRKRLKASKTIEYELACRFELFQFPPVANWNFSFTHTHMELRHTVATHQWTRKPVYYIYNIFFLLNIFFLITVNEK